ncbi:FGFR1 oncogene partner isoform X2 [Strongylocentrotus purpuratus]|uniref:EF-hand domain-containing protein n=1 Tax=Strongylocentrotus purpuratus TaxID=7668 RepID=A0A7M7GHM1_STRPU|nr:FGFR1 oncogene partner isoform X2 [Strongylocentrotus purpuratus]|eukprot:XP_003726814.1 PREDICTED: FGFR1 oncogene partner isoform X2 [Strongylocentrotus purpuratus]
MSADEDTELRDLIAQTLESTGVLGKIRAELRASVFLTLEEQDAGRKNSPFVNEELKKYLATKEGYHTAAVVKEFLEYFNLDFSLAVFNPETNTSDTYDGRESLASELNIADTEKTREKPLLYEILRRSQDTGDPKGRPRSSSAIEEETVAIPKDLTASQIADAKAKFEKYDLDKSGSIDKNELRNLFVDMFPNFHRNMLERYVQDEFQAGDKDFSSVIDFDEFLAMYRRLFVNCRSVVSHDISDMVPTSPKKLRQHNTNSQGDQKKTEDSLRKLEDDIFSPLGNRGQRSTKSGSHSDDSDAFFDDPLPVGGNAFGSRNQKQAPPSSPPRSPTKPSSLSSLNNAPPLGGGGGLGALPPLNVGAGAKVSRSPDWGDLDEIDSKIAKMGFDSSQKSESSIKSGGRSEASYEDDFQSSQDSPSQTPRGSNSQRSNTASITEEISEEISGDDSFLASSQDNLDDQTSDHTVSQLSQSGPFDYMEEVRSPTGL